MEQNNELIKKKCVPCKGDVSVLKGNQLNDFYIQLKDGWTLVNEHHLEKVYSFSDFRLALAFTVKVGNLSEQEGHHPDIYLSYGKVKISLWTHKIDGLSENDFILAAKCDELFS